MWKNVHMMSGELVNRSLKGNVRILKIRVSPTAYPLDSYSSNYLMTFFALIHLLLKETYTKHKIYIARRSGISLPFPTNRR